MQLWYNSAAALPFCLSRPLIKHNVTVNWVPFKIHLDKFSIVNVNVVCLLFSSVLFWEEKSWSCMNHGKICVGKVFLELDQKLLSKTTCSYLLIKHTVSPICFTEFQATPLGLFTNLPKGFGNSRERVLANTSSLLHCTGCSCHHWSDGNIKCISTLAGPSTNWILWTALLTVSQHCKRPSSLCPSRESLWM